MHWLCCLPLETLDWIGRLEIIERRWPKLYAAINSRLARLVGILFLAALIAHDIEKHIEVPEPPVVKIAPPPAPQVSVENPKVITRTLPAPEPEKKCWMSNHFGMPNSTIQGAVTATAAIMHCNYKVDAPYVVQVEFDRDFIPGATVEPDSGIIMGGGEGKKGRVYFGRTNSPALLSEQLVIVTVYGTTDQYPRALRGTIKTLN